MAIPDSLSCVEAGAFFEAVGKQMREHGLLFAAVLDGCSTRQLAAHIAEVMAGEDEVCDGERVNALAGMTVEDALFIAMDEA